MDGSTTPNQPVVPNTPNEQPASTPPPQTPRRVDGFSAPTAEAEPPASTAPLPSPSLSAAPQPPPPPASGASFTPPPTTPAQFAPSPGPSAPPGAEQAKPPEKTVHHALTSFRTIMSIVLFIVGIVVAATLINQFIFQSYYVDGTSMTPTLQNNDRLIIDKVEKTFTGLRGQHYIPKRGQIVVLDSSLVDQYGHSEQLIKRVIGLPGETITISGGMVTVKNSQHPEGFNVDDSLGLKLEPTYANSNVEVKVPDNQVFVLGDNRGAGGSFDSRAFGALDSSKIQGRLLARIFPLNKTGFF